MNVGSKPTEILFGKQGELTMPIINGIKITPIADNATGPAWDALRIWGQNVDHYTLVGKKGSRIYFKHIETGEYAMVDLKRHTQSGLQGLP